MSVTFGSDVVEAAEYKRKLEERLAAIEKRLADLEASKPKEEPLRETGA